jgi:hypothetical protein
LRLLRWCRRAYPTVCLFEHCVRGDFFERVHDAMPGRCCLVRRS